jgi:chromosome partitioning protein
MALIISILNHKGGTGKTTTTLNLGKALHLLGYKILLMDMDAQANLSQSLGIEAEAATITDVFSHSIEQLPIKEVGEFFHVVPASLELSAIEPSLYSNIKNYLLLKKKLEPIQEDYDFILIDCPPSLGILTQNALIASHKVLITVQAQYLALRGLETVYSLIASIKENLNHSISVLGLVVTQVNHTKLSKEIIQSLKESFQNKVFETPIRQNVSLAEASLNRKDIFSYSPESYGAVDYMNLAKEILQ